MSKLSFCFKDIITNVICPNGDVKKEIVYPFVKEIFNAIFEANDEYCKQKSKTNGLKIYAENSAQLSKSMEHLLRHAICKRSHQAPRLAELSEFWSSAKDTYRIDKVIEKICQILTGNSQTVIFNPSSSSYDKYFELLDNAENDEKTIINELRNMDSCGGIDYSKEAFVYLLASSLFLKKSDLSGNYSAKPNYTSASFIAYLQARTEQIKNNRVPAVVLSPEDFAAIQNTDNSFRIRLKTAAEKQLAAAAKYAERLSSMTRVSTEKLPDIELPVLNGNNDSLSLYEQIVSRKLKRAHLAGIGGAGKSHCLISLGMNLFKSNTIPMYIPLNELHGMNISEYITALLDAEYTDAKNNKTAVRDFLNGELGLTSVLLLDGFNEIADSDERSRIAREIRDLSPETTVIISSRYEITELYDNAGYEMLTLSPVSIDDAERFVKKTIPEHYCELIDMISEYTNEGKKTLMPFMSTPMALVLLVSVYKQRTGRLIHEKPSNIGQLIENYIQCISGCTKELFFSNETIDKLAYTGLNMSTNGSYEIDLGNCLRGYVRDNIHTDKAQFFSSDLFKSFTRHDSGKISFFHQNFRDGFAAVFLHSVLLFGDSNELNRSFELNISTDVRKLLADMISGSDCIRKHLSDNYEFLSAQCIGELISIAAQAEDNLSEYDLSELDLTASRLNMVKLYNKKSGNFANLSNSRISLSTISASGHTGKIDALLFLLNRFVVSFARDSFYCFDMELKKQYILVYCENSPVTDAIKYSDDTVVVNHTSGRITIYRYHIENDSLHFDEFDTIRPCQKSHSIALFEHRIYGACYDGTIFSFGIAGHKISDYVSEEYKYNTENRSLDALNFHTGPRIAVWGEKLCTCFENKVVVFAVNDKLTKTAEIKEAPNSDIHDIIAFDGNLFLNVRTAAATSISVYDSNLNCICTRHEPHTRSFLGMDRFAIGKGKLYSAVNIEDSIYQAGVRVISLCADGIAIQPCNGTRHTMSVNVCLPFKYKKQDYVATGSTDRSVEILKEKNDELTLIYNLSGHYEGIHSFCLTDNGEIITAQYSGEISLWKRANDAWKCVESWNHHDWAWEVRYIKQNKKTYAISCSYDHTIIIYNLTDHEFLITPIKSDSRITTLGVISNSGIIKIIYGISKTDDPASELNAMRTLLTIPQNKNSSKVIHVSAEKLKINGTIIDSLVNMSVRCIETDNHNAIICCADNASSRVFSCSDISVSEIQNEKFQNIRIRCVSFIGDLTVYGGDDPHSRAGKILLVKKEPKELYFDSPVSCVKVFSDKKRNKFFAVGTYGCKLYLYDADGNELCRTKTADKVLCIDVYDTDIMYSLLNGELLSIPIEAAIDGISEPRVIIKTTSGFGGFCGVDFSECIITDESRNNNELANRLSYYT